MQFNARPILLAISMSTMVSAVFSAEPYRVDGASSCQRILNSRGILDMSSKEGLEFLRAHIGSEVVTKKGIRKSSFTDSQKKLLRNFMDATSSEEITSMVKEILEAPREVQHLAGYIELIKHNGCTIWCDLRDHSSGYNRDINYVLLAGPYNEALRNYLVYWMKDEQQKDIPTLYGSKEFYTATLPDDLMLTLDALSKCPQTDESRKALMACGFLASVLDSWSEGQCSYFYNTVLDRVGMQEEFDSQFLRSGWIKEKGSEKGSEKERGQSRNLVISVDD
jgi:hypothetical protein